MEHTESIPPTDAPDPGVIRFPKASEFAVPGAGAGSPIPFRARHRSNMDEVAELMGDADPSFLQVVRRNYHEQEAGRHLAGRIGELSLQGDFTPNTVLDQVMREYDWLLNGNQLPVPGGVA